MSGSWTFASLRSASALLRQVESENQPRRMRSGAALTLVFVGVLTTGAATGSWSDGSGGGGAQHEGGRTTATRAVADSGLAPPGDPGGRGAKSEENGVLDADVLVSRSGDRWSAAYSAQEYEGHRQALGGEYVGVGISVRTDGGDLVEVAGVEPGSPAERDGIRKGDRLIAVDGTEVGGRPVTEVVSLLRGGDSAEEGSRVVLRLERDGRSRRSELRRATVKMETVTVAQQSEGVTRIRVSCFTEGSGDLVRRAVEWLPEGSGVLLDLRGNSGGLVVEAVAAASAFLDGGLVATYDVEGAQRSLYADPGGDPEVPLVVLVDGGTMSAAELLTGALQDRGRAIVVGSPTFGKGSVQMPRKQPDGSVAELTVGEYLTPSGREIEGTGLTPDLQVPPGESAEQQARTVLSGLGPPA